MTHVDFATLNSLVTFMYLIFIKKHQSLCVYVEKQKNLKWLYFSLLFILVCKMCLFFKQENC